MATINKLIKDNRGIILNSVKNLLNQQRTLTEENFYRFEGFLREKIYQQINHSIIALEKKNCTITEKEFLIEQVPLLSQLLFDYLNGENEDYWRVTQQQSWDFFDYDYTFIDPKKFTKEYINQRIENFKVESLGIIKEKEIKETSKNNKDKPWFLVGVELAKGEIHRLYKEIKNWDDVTIELFPDKEVGTFRPYLSESWADNRETKSPQKNIFTRTNKDNEIDEIIAYCIEQNYIIKHPIILERERQFRKENNLF